MLTSAGMDFPIDTILYDVRWWTHQPLSHRHLEEMTQERGVFVDYSSLSLWTIRFLSLLEKVFCWQDRRLRRSSPMDET